MTASDPKTLIANNRRWAKRVAQEDPKFFQRLSNQQQPDFLWIGCSDSRVPATRIVDLMPGEIFVHRNVANLVIHSDLSCLSAIQFAIDVLGVRHIIVCGHFGCAGVRTAISGERHGLVDNWLRHLQDISAHYRALLKNSGGEAEQERLLTQLNVITQTANVAAASSVQDAWSRGQALSIHGWVYAVGDGLLHDLGVTLDAESDVPATIAAAAERIAAGNSTG